MCSAAVFLFVFTPLQTLRKLFTPHGVWQPPILILQLKLKLKLMVCGNHLFSFYNLNPTTTKTLTKSTQGGLLHRFYNTQVI